MTKIPDWAKSAIDLHSFPKKGGLTWSIEYVEDLDRVECVASYKKEDGAFSIIDCFYTTKASFEEEYQTFERSLEERLIEHERIIANKEYLL